MARVGSGKNLFFRFVTSTGGTIAPNADFRTLDIDDSADEIDISAGVDVYKQFAAGQAERTGTYKYLVQTAASSPSGTTIYAGFAPQTEGTAFWGPEGSATGKPKYSAPAVILGRAVTFPYSGAVEATIKFRLTAADTIETW